LSIHNELFIGSTNVGLVGAWLTGVGVGGLSPPPPPHDQSTELNIVINKNFFIIIVLLFLGL
jgi:hypothetical protein